jgi:hypothetical protein
MQVASHRTGPAPVQVLRQFPVAAALRLQAQFVGADSNARSLAGDLDPVDRALSGGNAAGLQGSAALRMVRCRRWLLLRETFASPNCPERP